MIHTLQSLPVERAVTDNIVRTSACFVERRNTYVIMVKKSYRRLRHRREHNIVTHRGADKSLARPGRKQAAATEDFYVHISYLLPKLEEYYSYLYI